MPLHKLSVFIFRRDHRLDDNTALLQALSFSSCVVPCFIFDSAQIDPQKNSYFSNNCVQFMIESLHDLNNQLEQRNSRMFFFHGELEATVKHIVEAIKPDALFVNEDITPYSVKRDKKIAEICASHSIRFYSFQDIMILPKEKVLMPNGNHFKVFTPYFREASKHPVKEPIKNCFNNFYPANEKFEGEFPIADTNKFYNENPRLEVRGGRQKGLKILENIKNFKNYNKTRSIPTIPTTKLSAYNKFGCVSIREVYMAVKKNLGKDCKLMKELFWRDFYYYLADHEPRILEESMKPEYANIKYNNNFEWFQKWKEGKTGCPIVDAGMRHLNTTGYMPNRLRMIVANYLTKDLLLDWKLGEKYFAQNLVDYDPCQNNGGWQWSASTGADYGIDIRIFNPGLQSQKFDKDCGYILTWVPELKNVVKEHIHHWESHYRLYKGKNVNYPDPLVIHAIQRKKCIDMYKNAGFGVVNENEPQSTQSTAIEEEHEEKKTNDIMDWINNSSKKRKAEDLEDPNLELKKTKTNAEPISNQKAQLKITDWFKKSPIQK